MWHVRKLHLGHVTLHLGHVIDGASRMKTNDFLAGEQRLEQMLELMKSLCRTENRTSDLAVEVFIRSISIVWHTKFLSHDLNAF